MIKLNIIFFLLIVSSTSSYSQIKIKELNSSKRSCDNVLKFTLKEPLLPGHPEYNQIKKERNARILRNIGLVLTTVGTSWIAGGIIFANSNYPFYKSYDDDVYKGDPDNKTNGTIIAISGGVVLTGGIIMAVVGQKRVNKMKSRTIFDISPTSASFTYRF